MGSAASLFFSTNKDGQTLHRRIVPSTTQQEEQQGRWNDLADYLKNDLSDTSGCPMYTWLQGSYKFGTQLRPLKMNEEFDIDLGIYFHWSGGAENGDRRPLELKEMVHDAIKAFADENARVKQVDDPKTRCTRIHYHGNFHIDVPTYHIDINRDQRDLATQNDEWEDSDPKAIYLWFKDRFRNDTRFKVRRLIRYVKAWSILNLKKGGGRPSSLFLTVLTAQEYSNVRAYDASADDDALAVIANLMLARLRRNRTVRNPVDTTESLSDCLDDNGFDRFMEALEAFAGVAERAVQAQTELQAADIWSEIFGHFFPLPTSAHTASDATENAKLPVPTINPRIFVKAKRKRSVFRKKNEWTGVDRIGPIPKRCTIDFEVINKNDVPTNATIEWTVRNEESEAENSNDLGHRAGTGFRAQETSAYKGSHYMDCIIRRWGQVIGIKRVSVEIY